MLKPTKLSSNSRGLLQLPLPDTFTCSTTMKVHDIVDVYFGAHYNVLVITSHDAKLSKDNLERIRILTDIKE